MGVKLRSKKKPGTRARSATSARTSGRRVRELAAAGTSEPAAWATYEAFAKAALAFWIDFLRLKKGASNSLDLDAADKLSLLRVVRAVSWVESVHGTGSGHQPSRDPMQCGNPSDSWWQILRGDFPRKNRYVSGPGGANYWAEDLPAAAAADSRFPASAKITFPAFKDGHNYASFKSDTSFAWAIPHLLWNINHIPSQAVYKCADLSRTRLVEGAVKYNGGGDPKYRDKIDAALTLVGWPAAAPAALEAVSFGDVSVESLPLAARNLQGYVESALSSALRSLEDAATRSDRLFPGGINRLEVEIELPGPVRFSLTADGAAARRESVAMPAAESADIVLESAIDDLDLAPKCKAGATSLVAQFGADIVFTSGRRSVPDQCRVMAENVVKSGDRRWIEKTYIAGKDLQDWIDAHPNAKTVAEIRAGLESVLATWDEKKQRSLSYHLTGAAIDLKPIGGARGDEVKKAIDKLANKRKFLDREGGIQVWHIEFNE